MTESYVERELKFDVAPDFVVPDVAGLLPDGGRLEVLTEQLRSDYFDTADHALLRARMTLRHRTGSTDTGWQLKIPQPPFREEIRVDADSEGTPEELQRLLLGVTRGQSLTRIARVKTERSVTRLVDGAGRHLAEIDDDVVHASSGAGDKGAGGKGAGATASTWREVEVELGDDQVELLHVLGRRLQRAGAQTSASTSKLARALPSPAEPERAERACDVLAGYVAEQQRVMLAGDLALRRGEDSVVHKTRVATRRLRSTLRVYGELFDAGRAAAIDTELRWYAALLGEVRDRQVLIKRLDAMLDELDESLQLGPVRTRVDAELSREKTERWQLLVAALSGERYLSLLADVDGWVRQPPWTPLGEAPAKILAKRVERAEKRVSKRLERANATGDVHLLHSARKAAKRARYAAEAAEPVIGKKAAASHAKRYQKLQDLLGEHQDSIVSAELLRRLGAKAGTTRGENGFAFGVLHQREEDNARVAREQGRRIAKKYRARHL
jgi:CHAD domain-containing protein